MYQSMTIIGNLGRDPEMRYTPAGAAVTSFSVAASRKYTNSAGERVEETTWFQVSAWNKQAEVCNQYLKKGSKVLVVGELTPDKNTGGPRMWQKQDGSWGCSFEVRLREIRFLSSRTEGDGMDQSGSQQTEPEPQAAAEQDEIPF